MEESSECDDPLARKPNGILNPGKQSLIFLSGVATPVTLVALSDLLFVVFLFAISLFLSGIRAAYAAATAMENPWEKKSEAEAFSLPNKQQQLTLSMLQRSTSLLALILASRVIWFSLSGTDDNLILWLSVASLGLWIWLDAVTRFFCAKNAIDLLPKISGFSRLLLVILKPLILPFIRFGRFIGLVEVDMSQMTPEQLEAKSDSEEETELLKGLAHFRQTNAKRAMQARVNITAFDIELDFHELMDKINKSGYSRVPVYREDLDYVEGILNVKDLLPHINHDEHFNWQRLIRPVYFIPESKRLDDLMKEFQNRRVHMAIVVDEYGGTSGLITLEDIIEEIFGDINDEYDEDDVVNYTQVDETTYVFEGKVLINDLCRILNLDSDFFDEVKGNNESLAGLLLELFSRLPRTGEIASHKNISFKVQSADKRRIKKVRVLIS